MHYTIIMILYQDIIESINYVLQLHVLHSCKNETTL